MADKRGKKVRDVEKATKAALARYKKMSKKPVGPGEAGRIGFGMEPTYKPIRVKRDAVELDAHTTPDQDKDKNILYVPGWSLKEDSE